MPRIQNNNSIPARSTELPLPYFFQKGYLHAECLFLPLLRRASEVHADL